MANVVSVFQLYEFIYNICANAEFEVKSLGIVFKVFLNCGKEQRFALISTPQLLLC